MATAALALGAGCAAGADAAPETSVAKTPQNFRLSGNLPPMYVNGLIMVRTRPVAQVFLDGRSIGVSPLRDIVVREGQHVLVVTTLDGQRTLRREFVINANQLLRFDLTL